MRISSAEPGIDVRNLSFARGTREILRDVSFTVARAELAAMVGLNGAGKTTLISLLGTLARPTSGRVFVDGLDAVSDPDTVRSRIGVVFQESALEPRLSARDNLLFIARCQGLKGRGARQRVDELVEALGLDALAGAQVRSLSGGQRRRLELARALISRPPVLLLDEPTLGLDAAARRDFWSEIKGLVRDGRTVLCSTHYADEARDADRVVVLDRGAVLADDSWQTMSRPVTGAIRLHTDDVDIARARLAEQGYRATVDDDAVVVSCADPQAVLPLLLQRLPCRIMSADILTPDLTDVLEHWRSVGRAPATARAETKTAQPKTLGANA